MIWASSYWFKNGISYTIKLGASPQLEYLPAIALAQARRAGWRNGVLE